MLTQYFAAKSAKFQNKSTNVSYSGASAPPGGTTFFTEILILVSSISYLSMVQKAKQLFMGKIQFFKIKRLKISKILKFCGQERFFSFLQAITFDTMLLAN